MKLSWLQKNLQAEHRAPTLPGKLSNINRLAGAGIPVSQLKAIEDVELRTEDLPGDYLGLAFRDAIVIDSDADGVGCFVDSTPEEDSEFLRAVQTAGSAADDADTRCDLLTVIAHELGYLGGLEHSDTGLLQQ